jgi:tagatose-6-phosphate ketose/aldose isomerase
LLFPSSDAYARRFDEDLLAELRRDQVAGRVIQVGLSSRIEANSNAESLSCQPTPELLAGGDEWLAPLWLLMAQQYALQRSVSLGLTPDNPFPDGTVNRVVQGVTLHSYDEAR